MNGSESRWKARHVVLSILFVAWIVSFMDRMVISVAIPYIALDLHLSPLTSGAVMSFFYAGYALTQIPGGVLADLFGVRRVATFAMLWWSVLTACTGAAGNLTQMLIARFVFGLGEGVFPACGFKTIAVWFPSRERATAAAIMIASNPLGAALAPLAVVTIMSFWGWRTVFYLLFIPGLLVAFLFWRFVTDKPSESPRVSRPELGEIEGHMQSGASTGNEVRPDAVRVADVLRSPNIVLYFAILFCFDIAYWGFGTWLPTYLIKARGFSMLQMGAAASLPFFAGAVGSVLGGFSSDRYFSGDRRIPLVSAMLASALLLYVMFGTRSVALLVASQTFAGFTLNFGLTAFWALPMNTVPQRLVGVASGLINMAGQLAAFIVPLLIGLLVGWANGSFHLAFSLLIGSLILAVVLALTLNRTAQASTSVEPDRN